MQAVFGEASEPRTGASNSLSSIVAALRDAGCLSAEDEAKLIVAEGLTPTARDAVVQRRVAGEPLEYILGWSEFSGLHISVDPGVFVPRERTELLVREAAALAVPSGIVVDLCCGTGAVGLALAAAVSGIELHSCDIDPSAVACARRNVASVDGRVHQGDLYAALPDELRGRIGLLVANVPYVPTGDIDLLPREARLYEPRTALDGGADGLDVVRRVAAEAPRWLAPGGHVLIETSAEQAPGACAIFGESRLKARTVTSSRLDATVVVGSR